MRAEAAGKARLSRVVITRSRSGNEELAAKLRARGFEPVSVDTLEFAPPKDWSRVDAVLAGLGRYDWLVLTSPTGVGFFAERMRLLSLPLAWVGRPSVAAVGPSTGAALSRVGARVDFLPSKYTSKVLAEELPAGSGSDALLLRAASGDPGFLPALVARGFRVTDLPIYATSPLSGRGASRAMSGADAVVFASPSAVEAFAKALGPGDLDSAARRVLAVCIGPVTVAAAKERGFRRTVAPETHTIDGVLTCLEQAAGERS
ncbi:MAG: uroporphyrinogen-III synthase [Nitrososphaerota archaeon]|nr:uroporphyrinogen-III synthase [Nitrososphaerota archaeon]